MTPARAIYEALTVIVATPGHASGLDALVTGGVWSRRLAKPPSKGSTDAAFDEGGRVKPAIVVKDRGEEEDPLGPIDQGLALQSFNGFPQVWAYARAVDSGRVALEAVVEALTELFRGELRVVPGNGSSSVGVRVVGRNGIDDEPDMEGVIFDMLRLQVDGMWVS